MSRVSSGRPPAAAANPFAPRTYGSFAPLAEGVWLWRSIVNSTVVVGRDGVAVIDTQVNHAAARRLLSAIRQRFSKPVRWVINTHYHWDHCHGNAIFAAEGARVLASARTAQACIERQPRQKTFLTSRGFELGPDPLPPDVLIDNASELDLGGVTLQFRLGHVAETHDPTLVWCPQQRVLISGDTVMTGSFPIFGQPNQREGLENDDWLSALHEIRSYDAAVIAPGHGPAADSPALETMERIMRFFLDEVRREHAAGRDLTQTINAIERRLPPWIRAMPEVWGTPRYAMLRVWAGLNDLGEPGWQHVKPPALPPARAAIPQHIHEVQRWRELAEQALEGGDPGCAAACADAVIAGAAHDDAQAWAARGDILVDCSRRCASVLEKGDCFGPARAAYARALDIDAHCAAALIGFGRFQVMVAFRNGDDPAAGEALLDRAEADPLLSAQQRAELWFARGLAQRARGDERRAAANLRRALLCCPTYAPALLALRG